jgi:prepilin-type processing-associated H-X9-DG protein
MRPPDQRGAFTLIELLVVIGVVTIIGALIFPAIQKVRGSLIRLRCQSNLRQIGLALHQYHSSSGKLPTGVSYRDGRDPYPHMNWHTRLLPYLDEVTLWEQSRQAFAKDKFFRNNPPHRGIATVMPLFGCPADPRTDAARFLGKENGLEVWVAFTSYLGVSGSSRADNDGLLYLDSARRLVEVLDGTSATLLVGERPPSTDGNYGWWYGGWGQVKDGSCDSVLSARETNVAPRYQGKCPPGPYRFGPGRLANQCDAFHFWSLHPGGAHFLFADGSVHFLRYSADSVLPALATRAGGERVQLPE